MFVPMMRIGIVRMAMHQRGVTVPMRMRFTDRVCPVMIMPMMRIVNMPVFML
jgi:hypothetical protein